MSILSKPIYIKNFKENVIDNKIRLWSNLSLNSDAISMLEQNLDNLNWCCLSLNPNAIHLIEQNLDKVVWYNLSENPNAIHLIEQNLDKVDWCDLATNPNAMHLLFVFDYEKMKENNKIFKEDLCKYVFHPERVERFAYNCKIDASDYLELF